MAEETAKSIQPPVPAAASVAKWRDRLKSLGLSRSIALLTAISVSMSVTIVTIMESIMFGRVRPLVLFEACVAPLLIAPPIVTAILHLTFRLDEAEREFRLLATIDPLTGIYNRRYILELAEAELSRVRRYGGTFSILLLDIDRFKQINDRHGHFAGDAVLQAVSALFHGQVRPSDIVGRYGGEEFMFLLPETNCGDACEVADRIRKSLAETAISYGQIEFRVTASIGAASGASRSGNLDAVLADADRAMYQAKRSGRNRVLAADCTDLNG